MSSLPPLRIVAALLLAAATLALRAEDIDWNRARSLYQKRQRGEQLTADEQAYLQKAMEARRAQNGGPGGQQRGGAVPPQKSQTGLVPLTDLKEKYKGEDGGLYGGGKNEPPAELENAAKAATAKIQPLDAEGKPSREGKIVLLSIGMSNATMEFSRFVQLAKSDPAKAANVVVVDGAQGAQTASRIADENALFWSNVEQRLSAEGVSAKQVQVVWFKEANAGPTAGFPDEMKKLQKDIGADFEVIRKRYPNAHIAYLSSRIYAGYATTPLNPEPYAYESAFAVRWVIQDQLKNGVKEPVMLWGPYLWADGVKGRQIDKLVWNKEDFSTGDGTHPAESARQKVAELLLHFFKTDANAKRWFLQPGVATAK